MHTKKADLIANVRLKATEEALRRLLDEYATESFIDDACQIIEEVFWAITMTKVKNGTVESNDSVEEWHSRDDHQIEHDWKYLGMDRNILMLEFETYLETPWMHDKELDWLFLNSMTYNEYLGALDAYRSGVMSFSEYINKKSGKKELNSTDGKKLLLSLVGWVVWFAAAYGLYQAHPLAALLPIAASAWWFRRKHQAHKKIDDMLHAMKISYMSFETISQSWEIVWQQLEASREKGAIWSGQVYRLVEDRKAGR